MIDMIEGRLRGRRRGEEYMVAPRASLNENGSTSEVHVRQIVSIVLFINTIRAAVGPVAMS